MNVVTTEWQQSGTDPFINHSCIRLLRFGSARKPSLTSLCFPHVLYPHINPHGYKGVDIRVGIVFMGYYHIYMQPHKLSDGRGGCRNLGRGGGEGGHQLIKS